MLRVYAVIFTATVFVLIYCTVRASYYQKEIAKAVQRVLIWAIMAVFACIVLLYVKRPLACSVIYSIYFICINWMLYYLLEFVLEYAGYKMKRRIYNRFLSFLLGLDTISLFANIWYRHAFGCKQVLLGGKEIYYEFEPYFFYNIHLGIAYILMALVLICLIYKACNVPLFYRRKYLMVLFSIVFIVFLDAIYLFISNGVDIAILFYALAGISIYYFSLIYSPKEPLNHTLADVVHNMADALFILDMENICIFTNESAGRLLDIHEGEVFEAKNALLARCMKIKEQQLNEKEKEGASSDQTVVSGGREYHLRVQFRRLEDKKGRYTGSFFIVQDNTDEIKKTREEFYRTSHDSLTGFYNREYFYTQSKKCLQEHPGEEYLMICVDIGNFEMATALFGRRLGNELLIQASKLLRRHISADDVFGRFMSGKFVLLKKKSDFLEETFLKAWEEWVQEEKEVRYSFNVRVGVYEIESPFIPISVMCERAILAMGAIGYGETIAYYTNEMHENFLREQQLQGEIMNAIENGEFHVYLEPEQSMAGELLGARSLVQWEHPEKGIILSEEFFSMFEKNGMLAKLKLIEWDYICSRLSKWTRKRKDFYITVDISSKDFYFLDLHKEFMRLVGKYGILPKNLRLAISEDTAMLDMGYQLNMIKRLRDEGFVVELDDLGTVYAALLEEEAAGKTGSPKDRAAGLMEVMEFEKHYM